MKIVDNPKMANPATPSPITVPPRKATFIALGKLVFAASAVLTFAFVAMRIPMLPATAEKTAPITKAATMNIPAGISSSADKAARAPPAITTNTASIRYSALRNAKAPSAMYPDNFFILSLPDDCFFTHDDRKSM